MTAIAGSLSQYDAREDASTTSRVSGWRTVAGVVFCQALVAGLLALLGPELQPIASLIWVSLACLLALCVAHFLFFRRDVGDGFLLIIIAAFVVRLGIGVAHFLMVINPEYVERPYDTNFEWDYQWLSQEMAYVANTWNTFGFFSKIDPVFFVTNKNAFLTIYNAILYWTTGEKVLNYAAWNTLHAAYTAYIVMMLSRQIDVKSPSLGWIAVLIAFQPFGIISSLFWRDIVGQAWLALALALMILVRRSTLGLLIVTPIAAVMAFSVRDPYLLLPLCLAMLFIAKDRLNWRLFLVTGAAVIVTTFLGQFVLGLAFRRFETTFGGFDLFAYPGRLAHAIVGPFPWYQIFYDRTLVPHGPYMIPDFLQHVVNVTVYVLVIPVAFARWRATREVEPVLFFGLLLFLVGMMGLAVHSSYVSIGTAFMLPLLTQVSPKRIAPMLARVLFAFILANVLWWALGLGAGAVPT